MREAGLLGERQPGPHADADHHQVRGDGAAAVQRHLPRVDRAGRVAEVEDDAVLLVQLAHEVAELRAQHALHRALFRRHDVHLDAARAQRGGDLEADEARPHHDGALAPSPPAQ